MDRIEWYIEQVSDWKGRVTESLQGLYSEEYINSMLEAYNSDPELFYKTFTEKGVLKSYCHAIAGLSNIQRIMEFIPAPPYPKNVSSQIAAFVAEKSILAGINIGMFSAGIRVDYLEPHAKFGKAMNHKGETKDNLPPGKKGPGRKESVPTIHSALRILANSINPPSYTYTIRQFKVDLIKNNPSIEHLVTPVNMTDSDLSCPNGETLSIAKSLKWMKKYLSTLKKS